jgi:hypothetical protein
LTLSELKMGALAGDGFRGASCCEADRSPLAAAQACAFLTDALGYGAAGALHLNIAPACFRDAGDALHGLLNVARGIEQRQFALIAELVLMCLHTQQEAALAGCDRAAKFAQFFAARPPRYGRWRP